MPSDMLVEPGVQLKTVENNLTAQLLRVQLRLDFGQEIALIHTEISGGVFLADASRLHALASRKLSLRVRRR